jgi:hypothetical protein
VPDPAVPLGLVAPDEEHAAADNVDASNAAAVKKREVMCSTFLRKGLC